jgi:uncharacterized protein (TIGR02757 family)
MKTAVLRQRLDALYAQYDARFVDPDPLEFVRRQSSDADREVVGLVAAVLAYGNVRQIKASIAAALVVLGDEPAETVRALEPDTAQRTLASFKHRFNDGRDVACLLFFVRQMLEQSGSIEGFFAEGLADDAIDVADAIQSFSTRAMALDVAAVYGRKRPKPGVAYFFSRPSSGGACKRLNLFLRWMVREDSVDVGAWKRVRPGQLIVPLDTHVIRVGQCLRLTRLKSPGWRMAADITASLRSIDPLDPIRFDFSLCHLGMMNACGFGKKIGDTHCPLKGACFPRSMGTRSAANP